MSARAESPLSPDLVLAELVGGIAGFTYKYELSRRQTARIRRRAHPLIR